VKLSRRPRQDDYIPVVPFIDVLLVLLIFFMVSSTFTQNAELRLQLPRAEDPTTQQRQVETVEVSVHADGSYAINGRALVDRKPDTFKRGLQEAAGNKTDIPLILTADANATHQAVVMVMDVAGQLGFSKLSITTQRDEKTSE
jgi:biopolymer transport protein ExbD